MYQTAGNLDAFCLNGIKTLLVVAATFNVSELKLTKEKQ